MEKRELERDFLTKIDSKNYYIHGEAPGAVVLGTGVLMFIDRNSYIRAMSNPLDLLNDYDFGGRGGILEFFSHLETLVNQIILNYLKPRFQGNTVEVLDKIDLWGKIKLLISWGLINKKERNTINKLKDVRNSFAHTSLDWFIQYEDAPVSENNQKFRDDLSRIYKLLTDTLYDQQNWEELLGLLKEHRES